MNSLPYVVLVGDVGSGKSTLFEKLSGEKGRSSGAIVSYTRSSEILEVHGRLLICDTPGSNAKEDNVMHNEAIAEAINHAAVLKLLVVVKGDKQIENVLDKINKFQTNFGRWSEMLAFCITHMDQVPWTMEYLENVIEEETDTKPPLVFTDKNKSGDVLLDEVLLLCGEKKKLKVTERNFSTVFTLKDESAKMEKLISREIVKFEDFVRQWEEQRRGYDKESHHALLFEFYSFMHSEMKTVLERFATQNGLKLIQGTENYGMEDGYMINLSNQLKATLKGVVSQMTDQNLHQYPRKKCPFCRTTVERDTNYNDYVTCGDSKIVTPPVKSQKGEQKKAHLGSFIFSMEGNQLLIEKMTTNNDENIPQRFRDGCGRTLHWTHMTPTNESISTVFPVMSMESKGPLDWIKKSVEEKSILIKSFLARLISSPDAEMTKQILSIQEHLDKVTQERNRFERECNQINKEKDKMLNENKRLTKENEKLIKENALMKSATNYKNTMDMELADTHHGNPGYSQTYDAQKKGGNRKNFGHSSGGAN